MQFKNILILFTVFSLHCCPLGAVEPEQHDIQTGEVEDTFIDRAHQELSRSLFIFSNTIDSFFGGQRADDLPNGSRIRLYWTANKEENTALTGESAVRANIVLVETQKKLKVSFKNKYEEESEKKLEESDKKTAPEKSANSSKASSPSTFDPLDLLRWRLKFDSGIRVDIPPEPFAKLRLLKSWYFGHYELRPGQEVFWYLESGFGETTRLDLDRPISEDLLFRYENWVTWRDETDEYDFASGPILYQRLSDRRGLSYNLKILGVSNPTWHVNDYKFEVSYRQLLWRQWFFVEITPYVHFPKSREWEKTFGMSFKLEAVIGNY
ncbi:MAG: hypothetical protein Fur0010_15580 [Bdellovibrio sp.]